MENYKNKNIESMDNELWVDVYGYDGIYSVSNLGRVKSETRYVSNGKGGRLVKERILSQAVSFDGRASVNLCWNNISSPKHVSQIVWTSFNEQPIPDGKCIMHKNKIPTDNRLINLDCTSWSQSHSRNYQLGLLPHLNLIHATMIGSKWNNEHGVFINGELSEKLCSKCFNHKDLSCFSELNRNVCKECRSKELGVVEFGKLNRIKELKDAGLKKCSKCDTIKTINQFHIGTACCKECKKEQYKEKVNITKVMI